MTQTVSSTLAQKIGLTHPGRLCCSVWVCCKYNEGAVCVRFRACSYNAACCGLPRHVHIAHSPKIRLEDDVLHASRKLDCRCWGFAQHLCHKRRSFSRKACLRSQICDQSLRTQRALKVCLAFATPAMLPKAALKEHARTGHIRRQHADPCL